MMMRTSAHRLIAVIGAALSSVAAFSAPTHFRRGIPQLSGFIPQSWGRRRKQRMTKGTREKLWYGGYPAIPHRSHVGLPFKPMSVCSWYVG